MEELEETEAYKKTNKIPTPDKRQCNFCGCYIKARNIRKHHKTNKCFEARDIGK